jgi:hypothetical protein
MFLNAVQSGRQQRVELAGALQGIQVIASTDMGAADPDLRHRRTAGFWAISARTCGLPSTLISSKATPLFSSRYLARMQ